MKKNQKEDKKLQTGIKGKQIIKVDETNTARTMGSGTLDVFATPAMIALMEQTAWKSVEAELEEGAGTVGTFLEISHDAPTPLGMEVTCESELTAVNGRELIFEVKAYDERGTVGKGIHKRFIINEQRFMEKASMNR